MQRRKWALLASKKKEKGQKESTNKGKVAKRENESLSRMRREKVKKDDRNMMKSDVSEDDDKMKGHVIL